ncbi:hypothetical protein Tco_0278410 [Tanacetum coccineum]
MVSSSSLPGVNGRALTELMQSSGETKIPDFMKLFINQHIAEENLFIKFLRDQADDVRSRLTKMNIMKHEMEAVEDQDAIFDSLDYLRETNKMENDVLVALTQLLELVKDEIREKETHVDIMDLAD